MKLVLAWSRNFENGCKKIVVKNKQYTKKKKTIYATAEKIPSLSLYEKVRKAKNGSVDMDQCDHRAFYRLIITTLD